MLFSFIYKSETPKKFKFVSIFLKEFFLLKKFFIFE